MPEFLSPSEIGTRIALKRTEAGKSQESLAAILGTSPAIVASFERGEVDPVPGDWILLAARALRVDYRYFITRDLDNEDEAAKRVYRSLRQPTPADEFALRAFFSAAIGEQELRALLHRELPSLPPHSPLPSHKNYKQHGIEAARRERQHLRLGTTPIDNPFELLRGQGVVLCRQRLRDSTLAGLTVFHPRAGACVLVNYNDDLYRQFFSALHEYGHILFDREDIRKDGCVVSYYKQQDRIELRANAFAAAFLFPSEVLNGQPKPKSLNTARDVLLQLSRQYRVNTQVVLYAMEAAGWLSSDDSAAIDKNRPTIPRAEKVDPDIPPTLNLNQQQRRKAAIERGLDVRFVELVRAALVEDEISMGRAAELLDLPVDSVRTFLQDVGMAL
jgi:Zn-dependent peptidase ImmA (M78 family)/transcriptional regulator with XRE-family HTH domain